MRPLAMLTMTLRPRFSALLATLCLIGSGAAAQDWAAGMVNKTNHDFGTVARGADVVYKFEFKNTFKEDIHLKSVTSSCGCTSPSIENKHLKTYDTGYIVAKFNTRTFTGLHSATLTVRLEFQDASGVRRPGQVQLRVHGDIRGDIVFKPGSIDLGTVDQGTVVQKSVSVTYAGRPGWRIEDVRSTSEDFEVELVERRRQHRNIAYELVVKLRESAAPGLLQQQLVLVTNDSRNPRVPLEVAGTIQPQVSVAPATLALGEVSVGEPVKKRLIVRGKKPFRVTSIDCGGDGCFEFKGSGDEPKERHMIEVVFHPKGSGAFKRELVFKTDLGETFTASCQAYATVTSPDVKQDAAEGGAVPDQSTVEVALPADAETQLAQGD